MVVPDLEYYIKQYGCDTNYLSAIYFMEGNVLGIRGRPREFNGVIESIFGNSKHLWMWNGLSMKKELEDEGFLMYVFDNLEKVAIQCLKCRKSKTNQKCCSH